MAISRGPKIVTNGLVLALDASDNNSFGVTDLPIKNGLLVWLDAADDNSFIYSSGTEVSQWRDKSGNNFHANQATVGNQPSRNTVVNSRKSVNFSSVNADYLRVNNGMVFTNSVTAIVFIKPGAQNYDYANILDQDHGMDGANGWVIQRNIVSSAWLSWVANAAGNAWFNPNQISYVDNTTQIVTLRKGPSTVTLYSNGTSSTDVAIADQQIFQSSYFGLNIGAWRAGGFSSRRYNGEICEIVVYNRALSLTELKQVHSYLGQKWGVSNTDKSIVDLSGNNNHGLLGGIAGGQVTADMPLFDVYNKGALKLDGSTDYIAVENATSLNPTTVTVSIWVKRNGYQSSVASYLRRNYNDAYGITGDIAADNVRFRIHNGTTYPESPNATLSLNEWTNIVGTYDLANIKIYKNGVFVGQTAHTSAISYSSVNTTLTIGRDDPVAGRYMNANYGSVLIYSRALSATEILQNYEAQKSKFANTIVQQGLVLNLDAGNSYSYADAGTTWYDVSGISNNGALTSSPTYSVDNGGLILFNGSSQYVAVPNSSSLQVADTFTVCAWIKATTLSGRYGIFSTRATNPAGCWQFEVGTGSGGTNRILMSGLGIFIAESVNDVISANNWFQICVVKVNNATTGATLYVNGATVTNSFTSAYTIVNNSDEKRIAIGTAAAQYFSGSISQLFVYNTALSAAQVLQNYNATKSPFGL